MTSTQNPSSIHHYIPIFWTKQWIDYTKSTDECVVRFDRPYRDLIDRRVVPARCGFQKNLYAFPSAGPAIQALEDHFLNRIDDLAAKTLQKLIVQTDISITADEMAGWTTFMQSLFYRSPEGMRTTRLAGEEFWNTKHPELIAVHYKNRGPENSETYDEFLEKRTAIEAEQALLWTIPYLITNSDINKGLSKLEWRIFNVPIGSPDLLLSDDPLMRTTHENTPTPIYAMPLTPRHLLMIGSDQAMFNMFRGLTTSQMIKKMNKWTVESARHFVVATDMSQVFFIRKHFGTCLKPSLNELIIKRLHNEKRARMG